MSGKVLVVEDDMHMRFLLKAVFETNGYTPVLARDGRSGLREAQEHVPHLIVLDLMMPGQGGLVMYRELKADPRLRDIPVIVLSAVEEESFRHSVNMLRAGGAGELPDPDRYLEKPPDPERLIQETKTLLEMPGNEGG